MNERRFRMKRFFISFCRIAVPLLLIMSCPSCTGDSAEERGNLMKRGDIYFESRRLEKRSRNIKKPFKLSRNFQRPTTFCGHLQVVIGKENSFSLSSLRYLWVSSPECSSFKFLRSLAGSIMNSHPSLYDYHNKKYICNFSISSGRIGSWGSVFGSPHTCGSFQNKRQLEPKFVFRVRQSASSAQSCPYLPLHCLKSRSGGHNHIRHG